MTCPWTGFSFLFLGTAGDLDGDGRIDVVAPDTVTNEVHVWLAGAR